MITDGKTRNINVRFSPREFEAIRHFAAEAGMSMATFLRTRVAPDDLLQRFEEVRTVMAAAGIHPLGQGK